jgi:hypothetical protein
MSISAISPPCLSVKEIISSIAGVSTSSLSHESRELTSNLQLHSYAVDSLLLLVQGNIASYAAKEFEPSFPKGKVSQHFIKALQTRLNIVQA